MQKIDYVQNEMTSIFPLKQIQQNAFCTHRNK